jgi:hypothetical protein
VCFELQAAWCAFIGRVTGRGDVPGVRGGSAAADTRGQRAYMLTSALRSAAERNRVKMCKTALHSAAVARRG